MRDLSKDELQCVQGGFVITTAIVTLVASGVIATIYLMNSLVNLYIYNRSGSLPPQPSAGSTEQIGNEINTIADALKVVPH